MGSSGRLLRYRHGNRDGLPPLRELPGRFWSATVSVYSQLTVDPPRRPRRLGAPRHLLRLGRPRRRHRGPRPLPRRGRADLRQAVLRRQLLPRPPRPSSTSSGRSLIAGLLVMMVRRAVHASGKAGLHPARPAQRGAGRPPPRLPDRGLGLRRQPVGDRGNRVRARGRADRDGTSRLRRLPVRWLAGGAAFRGRRRGDALGVAARHLVVPRPVGDRLRRLDPLHEGEPHARQLREHGPPRPPGRQAAAADPARAGGRARRLRIARRLLGRCTCSSSTPAPSAASATRRARRRPPAGPYRRATLSSSCASRRARSRWPLRSAACSAACSPTAADGENGSPRRSSSARTASGRRRSGRACSATPASRSARSGSSRRRSSTSCGAAWSRRASSTPGLQSTLEQIHKSGNSFGQSRRSRGSWAAELDFRGQGRPRGAGRGALVRRRLRLVRPPLPEGDAGARRAAAPRRSRLRDPLRRRAQRRQRRPPGRRGGPVRDCSPSTTGSSSRSASSTGSSPATRTPSTR